MAANISNESVRRTNLSCKPTITIIGGWLLLGTGRGVTACSHQVAAICSDGLVVLSATQVLGVAILLAGIALFFTALYRALR